MTAAFARITELHDEQLWLTNPCARMLYRWLLRRYPAGKAQEIELKDFQDWSEFNRRRPRPYCLPWIWRALNELVQVGLLSIQKRYSRHCVKLVAHHPDATEQKTRQKPRKSYSKSEKTYQKPALKPQQIATQPRETTEPINTPTSQPVVSQNFQTKEEKEKTNNQVGLTALADFQHILPVPSEVTEQEQLSTPPESQNLTRKWTECKPHL